LELLADQNALHSAFHVLPEQTKIVQHGRSQLCSDHPNQNYGYRVAIRSPPCSFVSFVVQAFGFAFPITRDHQITAITRSLLRVLCRLAFAVPDPHKSAVGFRRSLELLALSQYA
jgi:hypothetical protein